MKEWILYILTVSALAGGLNSFWPGFHETISGWLGCMRYTYDVYVWRHCEEESLTETLATHRPLDNRLRTGIRIFIARTYPEYIPFSIVSITLVEKRSVLALTICLWLYRACTRTADDAVREWKEEHGLVV